MKQALYTGKIATSEPARQRAIMQAAANMLSSFDLEASPPENAETFYQAIAELAGSSDPFAELKKQSTEFALALRPALSKQIDNHGDPFLAAITIAMAGNIIDYGAHHDFDHQAVLNQCLEKTPVINDYSLFKEDIAKADTILYLADNCGELVFDGLLIEQLGTDKEVVVAVKERPVINDATRTDALQSRLPENCLIIDNGTACPGTPITKCSPAMQEHFNRADLIISKGQGNFETLSEVKAPIYFLLTIKCEVVAKHITNKANRPGIQVNTGDMVLLKNFP